MWILSCSGDLFGGKRLWLRPGTSHLLGRTSSKTENGDRVQYIDHKSVSRKHLLIQVGDVEPGHHLQLHRRTEIKVTDGSKMGTTLNGDKILKDTKTLDRKEYTIKLGSYEPLFQLIWHNVTLTCANQSKKLKGPDALADQVQKVYGMDIKLSTEYVSNETTHVVAKKRNVPPALQALAQGKWLISYAYIDALSRAAERQKPRNTDEPALGLLEEDFDANWPKEEDYSAPSGGEPVKRPDHFLAPNPDRADVFQDYVLVFLSGNQYDSLMPVVTSGGGKALLWDVEQGVSKVDDLVKYVHELAGKKGNSNFRLSQQSGKGGIIIVRHGEASDWINHFQEAADNALDQASIIQNEFLDAILTADASSLKRPMADTQSSKQGTGRVPATQSPSRDPGNTRRSGSSVRVEEKNDVEEVSQASSRKASQVADEQPPAPSVATTRRPVRRTIPQPRFQGFADIDPSQFQRAASDSPPPFQPESVQAAASPSMEPQAEEPSQVASTQHNTRKRPAPAEEAAEAEKAMFESITTGHAAIKRRKMDAPQKDGKGSLSKSFEEDEDGSVAKVKATKKKAKQDKQVDVKAELAKRREMEEEARRKDDEALREMADMDPADYQNLVKIEVMDLPVRERPARRADENLRSDRWDDAWNGRKNFKKFRAQGQRRDGPRLNRVIVTLEEVPRRSQGIGEEYWLSTATTNGGKCGKSKSQSQSQAVQASLGDDETPDAELRFRRRIQRSYEEDEQDPQFQSSLHEQIAGHAEDDNAGASRMNGTPSQTMATDTQRKAAGKRAAARPAAGEPAAKKARQTRAPAATNVVSLDDDDDDDGLKFRRRRR